MTFVDRKCSVKWISAGTIAALIAGCAHTSVKPTANTAVLVNYGTISRPRCKRADEKIIDGNREAVCRVALLSIDGTFVPHRNNTNPVPIGQHAMVVSCSYSLNPSHARTAIPPQETPLAVSNDFTEARTYYVWAQMEDDRCKVWVTDSPPP
jgi:hypothetical protein